MTLRNDGPAKGGFPRTRMRRTRMRDWSRRLVAEARLSTDDLIWPLIVIDGERKRVPVESMPGVERLSVDEAVRAAEEAAKLGIPAIALFPFTEMSARDEMGSAATDPNNLVCRAIRAIKRGPSGRMIEAEFVGEKGTFRTGPELAIRRVFDPPLRGAGFVVDVVGPDGVAIPAEAPASGGSPAPPAKPEKFILRGAGWGHGVGMCQTGAIAQANAGRDFRTIIKHYYPKAEIKAENF